MPPWTPEQVLALAPDSSAVGPARELASPAKWVSAGKNGSAVWGEAKGSGAKPYQTAIDLREPAFKCSCPSRKFPCKHALGLFLRFAQHQISDGSAPGWVEEWLDKRDQKSAKQTEKEEGPKAEADPEAAAKRAEKRWDRILAGLDECEAFLADVAGQGLLTAQSARTWDQMAARMVDAQAPGIARRLRQMGSTVGVGSDRASEVVGAMGNLALLIEAARRSETFDEAMRADVRSALGIPIRKEDLQGEKVSDQWDVLGQRIEIEDRLTTCRSWLLGRSSGRWAMHLAFSVAGQAFDVRLVAGTALAAELEFFPSAWPLRAHLETRSAIPFAPSAGKTWDEAGDRLSRALAAAPWAELLPVQLSGARLGRIQNAWFAVDSTGQAVKLRGQDPWDVLAMSGNQPSDLMGEWDGASFRLLSAWGKWGFVSL